MTTGDLIVHDRDAKSVFVGEAAENLKLSALNGCALIGTVKNPMQQQEAVNAVKEVKAVLLAVEQARKAVKEPLLEACRLLDAKVASFVEALKEEEVRMNTMLGNYQQEVISEQRRQEAERQAALRKIEEERQAEQRRLAAEAAEAERKRQEDACKIEEARQAELRRIAAEQAVAKSSADKARLEQERVAFDVRQKTESEAREKHRIADEAARAKEQERQNELAKQAVEAVAPVAVGQKAKGQVVKAVWDFEVVDIHLLYRMHPGFVTLTVNRSEINQALSMGVRDVKGLRVFEVVKSSTRQTSGRIIDV